jgi:hypothetical protein
MIYESRNFVNPKSYILNLCLLTNILLILGLAGRLGGGFGGEVEDLTAIVPSAVHAEGMAPMRRLAIGADRNARCVERVMRASIAGMRPGRAHSVYHGRQYGIRQKTMQQGYLTLSSPQKYSRVLNARDPPSFLSFAPIAQLVEQIPLKDKVVGSIPTGRTIQFIKLESL